jgi:hypothetical protein
MAINLDHVTEQITVTDTAANASLTVNPKGTGAFNIAAGSGGLNLSNGGTVTAITNSSTGFGYTTQASVAISAPTTAGGVQATATVTMGINTAPVASGGTGYTVGNVLTVVGGTPTGAAGTLTVSAVSGGVITAVNSTNFAAYSVLPSSPVSVTGGSGSGATFNPLWFTAGYIITNAGSGYVEQPTVTFSGGGGSGAAAYAVVGGTNTVRSIGGTLNFATPGGTAFSVSDTSRTTVDFWQAVGATGTVGLVVAGATGNNNGYISAKGTGYVGFSTNSFALEQMRVSHTASAVNYVQVTGAATGSGPTISAQGSDTNADLNYTAKGTGIHKFNSGGGQVFATLANSASPVNSLVVYGSVNSPQIRVEGASAAIDLEFLSKSTGGFRFFTQGVAYAEQFRIANTTSSVNYLQVTGSATGNAPYFITQGSDTNINFAYSAKGSGSHVFYTAGFSFTPQFAVSHTASAVNYVNITGGTTGNSPALTLQGSDANIGGVISSKGTGGFSFYTNNVNQRQLRIIHTASSVNFFDVTGGATGFGAVLSAAGSDTNIPAVVQPKGTGPLQAQQTDSTATGGNARGANAIDFQTTRGAASHVASGGISFIGGGQNNTASGNYAFIGGGFGNVASGSATTLVSGSGNTATGPYSGGLAGYLNTISGYFSFVGAGASNTTTSSSAVTTQSATMNGTTAVTLSGSNASIRVGQFILGTSISFGTYVAAISGTSLTLSAVASGSSTSTLTFYTPHGVVVGGGNNTATGSYSFIGGGGDAGTAGNRNVASGDWSTVTGGFKNTSTSTYASIGGGNLNTASGAYSTISGGWFNTASGFSSFVGSGYGNVASGFSASVIGGNTNIANSAYSFASGFYATSRGVGGYHAFGANVAPIENANGISQAGLLVIGKQTTNATPTVLVSDTNAAGTTNQIILPNNSAYFFTGEVVAGVTGGGNTKGWTIEGVIKRGANAASTALVGTPTVTSTYADAGASTWVIAVTADTTNGGLAVTFTGQAATTIRTVAKISTVEMTY